MRHLVSVALTAIIVLSVGCGGGGKKVAVTGTVKFPAQIKIAEQDGIELRFAGEDGKGGSTTVSPKDLTFSVKDLPSGKYKVVVQVTPYPGLPGNDQRTRALEPFNRKYDAKASPLSVDIGEEPEQKLLVDLDKNSVSKN